MILPPPRTTRTYTPFPYTTLFRPQHRKQTLFSRRLKCRTDNQLGSWLGRSAYERPRVLRKLHADCEARMGSTSRQRHVSQSPHRLSSKDWRKNVAGRIRSEEHTSELQSLMRISYAVFCLKNKNIKN